MGPDVLDWVLAGVGAFAVVAWIVNRRRFGRTSHLMYDSGLPLAVAIFAVTLQPFTERDDILNAIALAGGLLTVALFVRAKARTKAKP